MKKGDKILAGMLLLIIVFGYIYFALNKESEYKLVLVKVQGQLVKEIDLQANPSGFFEFQFDNHIGTLEIEEGAVRMVEMDVSICPRGICSQKGWIKKDYEIIVCLPNRITVEIVSNKKIDLIDDMVY